MEQLESQLFKLCHNKYILIIVMQATTSCYSEAILAQLFLKKLPLPVGGHGKGRLRHGIRMLSLIGWWWKEVAVKIYNNIISRIE
jgi:hypothetical protein